MQENIANSAHDIKSPTTALGQIFNPYFYPFLHLLIQHLTQLQHQFLTPHNPHTTYHHPTLLNPTLLHPTLLNPTLLHPTLIHFTFLHPLYTLGLAVESLLDTLDNDKPLTIASRQRVVETLHGMVHTISALTMIINRTVVWLILVYSLTTACLLFVYSLSSRQVALCLLPPTCYFILI